MKTAKMRKRHGTLREKLRPWEEYADIVDAVVGAVLWMAIILYVACVCAALASARMIGDTQPAGALLPEVPAVGVGRMPPEEGAETEYLLDSYTEGEGPAPEWWDPEEPMAAEWTAPERHDIGCPDWNVDSTLWGWDGHRMEVWEMELFSRIMYLEFWGTSDECCEAGVDSTLLLWDRGEYGATMGELLSAQYAPGYYVYSPYAYVWDWTYDAEGLADMRALCESRFQNGPEWCAPYFRLWYYHEWAEPAYEIDGVYFSVPRG